MIYFIQLKNQSLCSKNSLPLNLMTLKRRYEKSKKRSNPQNKMVNIYKYISFVFIFSLFLLFIVATLPITQNTSQHLQHDWAIVAAQIAKALADTITNAATNSKNTTKSASNTTSVKPSSTTTITSTTTTSTTPITTTSDKPTTTIEQSESTSITAAGSVVPNHEPRTEIREGVEWVSFVYSHHRVLRRYSIRTDVDQVDIGHLDDKFKSENCVSTFFFSF